MTTAYAPTARRGAASMDPRLRARRVAVVREQGRRRLHRVVLALGLVTVIGAAVGVVLSPLLDVDRVAVAGVATERAAAVRSATNVRHGAPLLLVDTGAIAARVEALPWVARASVHRDLPGTLRVEVTLRVPVAWQALPAGGVRLLDDRGVTVGSDGQAPAGLPEIVGDAPPLRIATRVAGALTPALRDRVAAVMIGGGQATLSLVGGQEVRLGAPFQLGAKVRAAVAVLEALTGTVFAYLDVRAPAAPVTG